MACNLAAMGFLAPLRFIGKVIGTTEIGITDAGAKKTGSSKNAFFHYKGEARSGDDTSCPVDATILAFDNCQKEEIECLHCRLNLISHPNIMRCLGYARGLEDHQEYIFLAFPLFEETLAFYMEKDSKRCMELGRFTEEFIGWIRCIVYALLALHAHGFYCPRLSGRNVVIVKENNKTVAKLLDFQVLDRGNEKAADKDWVKLGYMLKRTADNYESFSVEIDDLFRGMKNGTLKGRDILKQSAMLTVRKKFENVMALNTFILTKCKKTNLLQNVNPKIKLHCKAAYEDNANVTEQLHSSSLDEVKRLASFKNILDSDVGWIRNTPAWISKKITELGFNLPTQDTLRELVWKIRCLIEHANKYPPPKGFKNISSWEFKFNEEQNDLESEFRKSWPYLFLNIQKFAASLALKY